jgi:hypothetical protein
MSRRPPFKRTKRARHTSTTLIASLTSLTPQPLPYPLMSSLIRFQDSHSEPLTKSRKSQKELTKFAAEPRHVVMVFLLLLSPGTAVSGANNQVIFFHVTLPWTDTRSISLFDHVFATSAHSLCLHEAHKTFHIYQELHRTFETMGLAVA